MTMEPILLEQLEAFKTELKECIEHEVEKLIDTKFAHIDRVDKFVNHRTKIGQVLDEAWVNEISDEFEKKAQSEYSKLYYKYAQSQGKMIAEFSKDQKNSERIK